MLPLEVQRFLLKLYDSLYDRDVKKVRSLYENDFVGISRQLYSTSPWPQLTVVMQFYREQQKEHPLILILYQELYCRHIFSHVPEAVSWELRLYSWQNYGLLLDFLASSECMDEKRISLTLPYQWLWDVFDEFLFQYIDTQKKKFELLLQIAQNHQPARSDQDNELLSELFNTREVAAKLMQCVQASNIWELMKTGKGGKDETNDFSSAITKINTSKSLKYHIGYAASVALVQMNTSLCDYHSAAAIAERLPLEKLGALMQGTCWHVPSMTVTLARHASFSFLCLREYAKAAAIVSGILPQAYHSREVSAKASEKLTEIAILAQFMSHGNGPLPLGEFLTNHIKDNYSELLNKLQNDPEDEFPIIFRGVCPRFVSGASWDQSLALSIIEFQLPIAILTRQIKVFCGALLFKRTADQLLSFTKLYNNLSLKVRLKENHYNPSQKLGDLMGVSEDVARTELLSAKDNDHSTEIFVDSDVVHIVPTDHDSSHSGNVIQMYKQLNNRILELINVVTERHKEHLLKAR